MNQPNSRRSDLSARDRRRATKLIADTRIYYKLDDWTVIRDQFAAALKREREEALLHCVTVHAKASGVPSSEIEPRRWPVKRRTAGKGRKKAS
jgi:hypothetical protein